ncbi:hypothetical protein CONPUDRAFT_40712, partial [Coniophora puteana RWD-64-598 SS2]
LNWVTRAGTKAAQKTPEDASRQLLQLFFRLALTIRDYDIPDASLVVNFDQTQVIVAHNDNRTYDQRGAKQVAITNKEEKRAWTAVVGVSASGEVLPLQVIMKGSTSRSLPSANAPRMAEARSRGFIFSLNRDSYWSSVALSEEYFELILVPYFIRHKARLHLDDDQACIVLLDCWSVHRSAELRSIISRRWPWIRLRYVPGGMTPL